MFGKRASESLTLIERAESDAERGAAAHKLVGAARAIGANALADAAAQIERTGMLTSESEATLSDAMSAVIGFLETRMPRADQQTDAG